MALKQIRMKRVDLARFLPRKTDITATLVVQPALAWRFTWRKIRPHSRRTSFKNLRHVTHHGKGIVTYNDADSQGEDQWFKHRQFERQNSHLNHKHHNHGKNKYKTFFISRGFRS